MKKIIFAICIIALIASPAFAADSSNDTATDSTSPTEGAHSITLVDTNGGGGGVLSVKISNNSTAAYSAATTAGGLAGIAGQVMCVVTASLKADPEIGLYFGLRGSNDPSVPEDNNLYQNPAGGTTVANSVCVTAVDADISGWSVRGGS